ncbi:MAG TPA: hypothetical protein VGS19_12785 [Streptosporangiaceae bacterium]|nr:hypothetical protein [Streptosporangiaceae bacterium]
MSSEHDIFIDTSEPPATVRDVIAGALGGAFQPSLDPEPVPALAVGATKVFFHDSHPFEDDTDFPASRYRYWVSVEDSARDDSRQLAVAQRVFDAVKAAGWPSLLSYDLQGFIAQHP